MSSFSIPAINDRFEMLRQLGNSFIVQPNVLKSYLTEGHLGRIDARLLRPYLMQRSDWGQFSRTLVLDDGLPVETERTSITAGHGSTNSGSFNTGPGGGMGSMFKGSRLSAMSGVAGVGMGKLRELLKEFDNLSHAETEAMAKRERERDELIKSNPEAARAVRNQYAFPPVYLGMR